MIVEIVVILFFIYGLYGRKFSLNIAAVLLISLDVILMQFIYSMLLPSWCGFLVYLFIIVFCIFEFGFDIRKLIINNVLWIIFMTGIQIAALNIVDLILADTCSNNLYIICVDVSLVLFSVLINKIVPLEKISRCFLRRDVIPAMILIFGSAVIFGIIYFVRKLEGLYEGQYLALVLAIVVICLMAVSWEKYKIRAAESEMELQAYRLYEESYKNLILDIRMKQHDFNNHINAIYSQHQLFQTYEELVKHQRQYCQEVVGDNKYVKLLSLGNSMIIGFLYGKFLEADSLGIDVKYDIHVSELKTDVPVHKLVGILGNLINNALDAVKDHKDKYINVEVIENESEINFSVGNVCEYMTVEQISKLFKKGFSSKGDNRGLGLYSIKKLSNEFGFEILCRNELIENRNWIIFNIKIRKPAV